MEDRNIITLRDENNKETEFEVIATLEINETEYAILLPLKEETDEGLVFKILKENGEEILEYVDDDKEIDMVSAAYNELLENE
ncbi:DUF1292 domain-containing protein [Paramaledivibacter caminithermalis]|uniref:UPF0473 protein SAMN02745912_00134 n=1 Tax=Paramaledivibacter caminithermalis (strain DSM 15212 / CIP 107654 / DViRD3) TaxID=1121301 RepID=A0A1M6JSS9_PARC5|nr:DUF1292 domain-containing protein [Paramaledivibacter caminithermalis]SHJ49758.1 Protein of unknown function [Paramaledivibacter caminithermalis DSM 15212]